MVTGVLPRVTLSCKTCSKEFTVNGDQAKAYDARDGSVRQYCSAPCYAESKRVPIPTFECGHCGSLTERKKNKFANGRLGSYRYDQKFCSKECGHKASAARDRRADCKVCGTALLPTRRLKDGRPRGMNAAPKTYCSQSCAASDSMSANKGKGAGFLDKHGYRLITIGGFNVPEHRYVMAKKIGRALFPEETVHHRDGNRQNNDEANLELWSSRHGKGQRVEDKILWCLEFLGDYPRELRAAGYAIVDADLLREEGIAATHDLEVMGIA